MTRFPTVACAITLLGALTGTALAQSQAEIAAQLNEEGKQLMFQDKPAEAAKKFQEAVARVPEAKYFVNLCAARLQEGKLDEALTACNAVDLNNPSDDQKAKAGKLTDKIKEEAKKQNLELHPGGGGGGDPGQPVVDNTRPPPTGPGGQPPPPSYRPAVGRPLGTNLVMAGTPDNQYTWTLGIDLFGGGGKIGQDKFYGTAVAGFRLKGDYILDPRRRLGTQVYLEYSHFGQGKEDTSAADTLDIVDFGIAGYKHFCLGPQSRACVTPLVGLNLSLMSPAGEMDETGSQLFNYLAVGGRAEVSIAYAFGRRFEHVLGVSAGIKAYTEVLQGPSGESDSLTIRDAGLDKGGAFGFLALGYTYRFNTPLGSSPFVTLE